MARATAPIYVEAPNPVIPRYGLFSVATGPLDLPVHARIGGLHYEIGECTLPLGYDVNCITAHNPMVVTGGIVTNEGYPFVVYSGIQCSPIGLANWGQERIRKYLYRQLVAGEQAAVENVFSQSANGVTNGLALNPAAVNLGAATDVVNGISQLEAWLYSYYGLPGVLHVPMIAAGYLKNGLLLTRDSSTQPWRTVAGTAVSFGNYAGLSVTGGSTSATHTFIYITGQVAVWRTPDSQLLDIPLGQIINRTTNLVDIVMEREYIVNYDCYVAGIQVPLGPPATTTG